MSLGLKKILPKKDVLEEAKKAVLGKIHVYFNMEIIKTENTSHLEKKYCLDSNRYLPMYRENLFSIKNSMAFKEELIKSVKCFKITNNKMTLLKVFELLGKI